MRNRIMCDKAVKIAAELYMEPNATWHTVSVKLNTRHGYPLWCESHVSKKVRTANLIPDSLCPSCKVETQNTAKNKLCWDCDKRGETYVVAQSQQNKTRSLVINKWLYKPLV